jgi:hypothetical protein
MIFVSRLKFVSSKEGVRRRDYCHANANQEKRKIKK